MQCSVELFSSKKLAALSACSQGKAWFEVSDLLGKLHIVLCALNCGGTFQKALLTN